MTISTIPNVIQKSTFFCIRLSTFFQTVKFSNYLLLHLFWSYSNNMLILYRSIIQLYFLILVALTCSFCFSSSKAIFNPFFLTLFVFYYVVFLFLFNSLIPTFLNPFTSSSRLVSLILIFLIIVFSSSRILSTFPGSR